MMRASEGSLPQSDSKEGRALATEPGPASEEGEGSPPWRGESGSTTPRDGLLLPPGEEEDSKEGDGDSMPAHLGDQPGCLE